jgi:predicted glutamine amidotransferase
VFRCHLLGLVSNEPTTLATLLPGAAVVATKTVPADGRGLAVWSGRGPWTVHKSMARAGDDREFEESAARAVGHVLVAHVRHKTAGRARMANTHPFCQPPYVFAHVGAVEDLNFVRRRCSTARLRQVEGDTDSEILFAYLLSCIDVARTVPQASAMALTCALRELASRAPGGTYTFVLSDGATLYAYRRGPPLFVVDPGAADRGDSSGGILVASAPLTERAWRPLADGELVQIVRDDGGPTLRVMQRGEASTAADSRPELPFTD